MLLEPTYFDYNATSPLHPELKPKIMEWLDAWGNPSSVHAHGRVSKKLVREARASLAEVLSVSPTELIFTSGGSEGNNTVIGGLLDSQMAKTKTELITTKIEHPSLVKTMSHAESRGFKVHRISVSRDGEFDFEHFEKVLSEKTLLVSVMLANNETGAILPLEKITKLCKEKNVLVHTDAVQALGKIKVNLPELGVDFATFSGHKFYALKGTGFIYSRRGQEFFPYIHGGGQERGRRSGTENVLAIASMGFMAEKLKNLSQHYEHMKACRDLFETQIVKQIEDIMITGQKADRAPNTSSVVIRGVHGESLLISLDVKGFSVSTGSACSSGSSEPSAVLQSMGLTHEDAQSTLRVSMGWFTTTEDVLRFVEALVQTVQHLRGIKKEKMSDYARE
ncbi:MAG: cysteine desulfurase [Bdellovibrionaceae bacterium]|nr:cysteine desulfurase [Pseudobdellovibrionaceae bacterium]